MVQTNLDFIQLLPEYIISININFSIFGQQLLWN
jgi:hypothetical protein